jgi:protein-S-isoprenylcysteine O-methyltransferase Ste14
VAHSDHSTWHLLYTLPWLLAGLWWLVRAFFTERTERKESVLSRLSYLLFAVPGGVLLAGGLHVEVLQARLWPRSFWVAVAGLALEWIGVAFAIWARESLGRLWSGTVTLKEGHRVVRTGPYRFVRHPIYTGALIAVLGPVLAHANLGGLLGLVLIVLGILRKLTIEETLLEGQFGEEYRAYRREVRMLIPFVI